ncbi:hypothetical protein KAR48_20940 [bacterium]|nr:hypothetical protein [bacterium]
MKNTDLIFGIMASLGQASYSGQSLRELTRPFGVSESSLRTNLSRMVQKRIIETCRNGRQVSYSFAAKGESIRSNIAKGFKSPDWEDWDETWWGVLFSVPEIDKEQRHRIRTLLGVYRFVPLYAGIWICPAHQDDEIEERFSSIRMNPHCRLVRLQMLDLISRKDATRLWKLDQVNSTFSAALNHLYKSDKEIKVLSPESAFVMHMKLGEQIVNALAVDPLLPAAFLPDDWLGDRLKTSFNEWSRMMQAKSESFWGNIIYQSI